jgi:cytochrome c-type biogenesis protein CcmH/NrfG
VNDLTIGLLSALLATNQPQAVSNLVQQHTGVSLPLVDVNDPAERELRNLMIGDDAALDEVNDWINTNNIARTNTPAIAELNQRIHARFDVMKHGYDSFLRNHPDSARGFLAYGSFLNDIGDEDGAKVQYENSKQLDPKNPAVWNQLANYFGEHGELTNAFAGYTEAIRLDPAEPVYYQNFATTVYLYRKDAREFYGINEQQVFDKALGLYQQAMKLAPQNLVLAVDYAESYYGIKPLRTNDALVAWTNALNIAKDDNEREGVLLHLARVKTAAGFYDEAQAHLDAVTNAAFADLKNRLVRSLADHKNPPTNSVEEISTNSVVASTNLAAAVTNVVTATTNRLPVLTNGLPALTNPPVFSPKIVAVMTNVPPIIPKASGLQAAPPSLREQKPH